MSASVVAKVDSNLNFAAFWGKKLAELAHIGIANNLYRNTEQTTPRNYLGALNLYRHPF